MHAPKAVITHLGLLLGIIGGALGWVSQGLDAAVLLLLIGYFLGKSVQSTLWTITGGG